MPDNGRDMRLLDGRRVQVMDLVDGGLLTAGDALEFVRPRIGESYTAEVTAAGRLRLPDGREFAAPSKAAAEAAGLLKIDGWSSWALPGTTITLSALRQELLSRTAAQSPDGNNAADLPRSAAETRHAALTAARDAADAGTPRLLTVRELMGLWGARARGHMVVDRVSADLDNHSLTTDPDFRKVAFDTQVTVIRQSIAADDTSVLEVDHQPRGDELDVGLTLGNVRSALAGITGVNPNDSLAKAMTLMRLNDFSQLAVMTSPRSLTGAVTWRSIAKALAHDADARLVDAIEPARDHPFDRDLVDALPELYLDEFVFVRDSVGQVSGIVTTADVVQLYGETATPFFIIGEVDHLLRGFISDEWTIDQVKEACDPEGRRTITSHDDLTIGDYQRMLESPTRFDALGWPLDRSVFVKRLDEVREIRNSIAHFDPDPIEPQAVASLRKFLNLLRDLRTHAIR